MQDNRYGHIGGRGQASGELEPKIIVPSRNGVSRPVFSGTSTPTFSSVFQYPVTRPYKSAAASSAASRTVAAEASTTMGPTSLFVPLFPAKSSKSSTKRITSSERSTTDGAERINHQPKSTNEVHSQKQLANNASGFMATIPVYKEADAVSQPAPKKRSVWSSAQPNVYSARNKAAQVTPRPREWQTVDPLESLAGGYDTLSSKAGLNTDNNLEQFSRSQERAQGAVIMSGAESTAAATVPIARTSKTTAKANKITKSARPTRKDTKSKSKSKSKQHIMTSQIAGGKITLSFQVNKRRVFGLLHAAAVLLIVAASGYLIWDTYMTSQAVKANFANPAAAMSIAGTNPATADQTAISQEDHNNYTVPADQPRYLYVPAIGVNARVMSVGVNSKGNIDTPSNLNDTAWYDGSAKPGQDGQVFIDGHTSFSNSIGAAFNDLAKLKSGDDITIETGNGNRINYTVTKVETVNATDVNMGDALNPQPGTKKGLTLMTCTGTFNYRTQTADKRLIVYANQQ